MIRSTFIKIQLALSYTALKIHGSKYEIYIANYDQNQDRFYTNYAMANVILAIRFFNSDKIDYCSLIACDGV